MQQMPPDGPTYLLMQMYGEMREGFGKLAEGQIANRKASQERTEALRSSLNQRIDDVREDLSALRVRMDTKTSIFSWIGAVPWQPIIAILGFTLGTLGILKPDIVRVLTGK